MYRLLIILFLFPSLLVGQDVLLPDNNNLNLKGVIYSNEFSIEAKLHTLGMTIGFNKAKIVTYHTTKFYHFDIGFLNSSKEKKNNIVATGLNVFNTYSYGKRNYFFPLRIGMGIKKYLSEKDIRRGLAIGYSIEGGPTLGVLKADYILVKNESGNNLETMKYSEENAEIFKNENLIYDRGPFFKGFDEINIAPGIHINAAIHYALKAYEQPVYALETGIMIDAFINRVPIMVETSNFKNKSIFINVYINIQLGKRWN